MYTSNKPRRRIWKNAQKYGNKDYKVSLKREVIDFDNMGPEIVPNEATEEE